MRDSCIPIVAVAGMALASVVLADIVPIAPFAGDLSEDFEAFPDYYNGGNTDTLAILGGGGVLSSNGSPNQLWVINPNAGANWGLDGYGTAGTIDEQAMGLFNAGELIDVTLSLGNPASELGFYFVTADTAEGSTMTVLAFDANGNQLGGDQTLDSFGNTYVWAGWSSATGIASLTFTGNVAPVIDDVQYNVVPAPASFAVLLGLGALSRRRRG